MAGLHEPNCLLATGTGLTGLVQPHVGGVSYLMALWFAWPPAIQTVGALQLKLGLRWLGATETNKANCPPPPRVEIAAAIFSSSPSPWLRESRRQNWNVRLRLFWQVEHLLPCFRPASPRPTGAEHSGVDCTPPTATADPIVHFCVRAQSALIGGARRSKREHGLFETFIAGLRPRICVDASQECCRKRVWRTKPPSS